MQNKFFGLKFKIILLLVILLVVGFYVYQKNHKNIYINYGDSKVKAEIIDDVSKLDFKITKNADESIRFRASDPHHHGNMCMGMEYKLDVKNENIIVNLLGIKSAIKGPCVDLYVIPGFNESLSLKDGEYNLSIKNRDLIDTYKVFISGNVITVEPDGVNTFSEVIK